jgi:thiamine-phosphate pyrophosphorylase
MAAEKSAAIRPASRRVARAGSRITRHGSDRAHVGRRRCPAPAGRQVCIVGGPASAGAGLGPASASKTKLTQYPKDTKLIAWGRAAAARHHGFGRRLPIFWLFTDARRLPDPRPAVARLPRGLAGVVLRHDGEPERTALGRDLVRICRSRRLALVVAGDVRLAAALGAGVHLRAGRWPSAVRRCRCLITSSAHGPADLRRARLAGAELAFLSPTFATASHPDALALGPVRWVRWARTASLPVAALGGVDGFSVRRLPLRDCQAVGAIGALA